MVCGEFPRPLSTNLGPVWGKQNKTLERAYIYLAYLVTVAEEWQPELEKQFSHWPSKTEGQTVLPWKDMAGDNERFCVTFSSGWIAPPWPGGLQKIVTLRQK